jgi:hypothetical protein
MSKSIEKKGKELGDWVADKLPFDKLIGGIGGKAAEAVDNPVFRWSFAALFEKIPEEHDERVSEIVDAIISGNGNDLIDGSVNWLVGVINTPLGDAREMIIGKNLGNMVRELALLEMGSIQSASTVGGEIPPGDDEEEDPPS